ncbi:MAG: aminotransferase class IV [Deltaproteobacteria bacterium]|nr:aminotransferase class IV [Deltaproteobacteria bacterium]
MTDTGIAYFNGNFIPESRATVPILSHSFGRGSAIFEVLSFHEIPGGRALFRLDEHIHRFFRSAELLEMTVPLTKKEIAHAVRQTVQKNSLAAGFIKIIGYYPQISYEVLPPQESLDVAIFAFNGSVNPSKAGTPAPGGFSACLSRWRKLDPETVPVEAKVAANYLNGMVARREALKRGFDYVIMLDTEGGIAEGATESVFFVKDGVLLTPSLGPVLASITRLSLLQAATVEGIETREEPLSSGILTDADEIFLGGTLYRVRPIGKIEGRVIEGTPGPLTRHLANLMDRITAGQDDRFADWLFPL